MIGDSDFLRLSLTQRVQIRDAEFPRSGNKVAGLGAGLGKSGHPAEGRDPELDSRVRGNDGMGIL